MCSPERKRRNSALLVFSAEHGIRDALGKGTAVPGNSLEIFFAPGDADTEKIEHYYQFITDMESTKILDFPWLVETRNFRRLRDAVQCTTRKVSNGYVTRIHVPWEILYNKLPFQDKADNFWRLSVIRWAPGGGQTWGGVVHAATTAGYIRFPHYTDEQKAEIQEYVLNRAWEKYRRDLATYGSALVMDMKEPYRKELPKRPRSFMNMQEDRVFVEKVLIPMEKERNDLGAGIASFSGTVPLMTTSSLSVEIVTSVSVSSASVSVPESPFPETASAPEARSAESATSVTGSSPWMS